MKPRLIFLTVVLLSVTIGVSAAPFRWDRTKPNDLSGQLERFRIAQISSENSVILTHDRARGLYFFLNVESTLNLKKGQRLYPTIKSDTTTTGQRLFEKDLICTYRKRIESGAKEYRTFDCILKDNQWTGKF
jgi:hypothetical protein